MQSEARQLQGADGVTVTEFVAGNTHVTVSGLLSDGGCARTAKTPNISTKIIPMKNRMHCHKEKKFTSQAFKLGFRYFPMAALCKLPLNVKSPRSPRPIEMISSAQAAKANQRAGESKSFENRTVTVTTPVATVINCLVESAAKSNACFLHSSTGRP